MKHLRRWFSRYPAGQLVPEGVYWNLRTLRLVRITGAIDFLPGKPECRYVCLPVFAVPVIALLTSLLYIIAFPLVLLFLISWRGICSAVAAFRHLASMPAL